MTPDPEDETIAGARAAATLIVLRDPPGATGAAEVLMIERAATMAFAAGAIVFPGGAVDDADRALANSLDHGLARADAAARVAAIRETIEEAGLLVGVAGRVTADVIAAMRVRLHGGASLAEMLAEHDLTLALDRLEPFARWCPPARFKDARRFDARFFVAGLPSDQPEASADAGESVRLRWDTADRFLEDVSAGRERAIFPTLRNLERLAQAASHAEAIALARAYPIETIMPWIEEREGQPHLCIPDHLGYPVTSQLAEEAMRG